MHPLTAAINAKDYDEIRRLVANGTDINARVDDGASVLFCTCMTGDVELVRLLLDLGADPNLVAEDPAMGWYAPVVLDLALSAQALMNWDKYTPIVELLLSRGAKGWEGEVWAPTAEEEELRKQRSIARQSSRTAKQPARKPWWRFW